MIRRFLRTLPAIIIVFAMLSALTAPQVNAEDIPSASGKLELTQEEKDYISSHNTVTIGYVQDRIPVSFSDDNGEFAGISRYIFDHISELCGIKFKYVALPAGDITYSYLVNGGFDLVSSVEFNEENKHAKGILISDPYLSSKKVVVAKEGTDFKYDAELSIAISTGSQTLKKVLNAAYPNFKLVDYSSVPECFDAVNSGKADLLMLNQHVVEYWIAKPIYEKLKVIPVLGLDDKLCFSAVFDYTGEGSPTQEEGAVLIGILNKAIALMSEDEVGAYTIQAISENQYDYTFSDFLYHYRFAAISVAVFSVVIIVLTAILSHQHVRLLENKANENAKNRFLSTMSHEIRTPLNGIIGLNHLMSQKIEDPDRLKEYLKQSDVTANYLLSLVNDMLDMSSLQAENLELSVKPIELDVVINTVNSIAKGPITDKQIKFSMKSDLMWKQIVGDEVRIQQVLLNLLDNAKKFTPAGGTISVETKQKLLGNGKVLTTVKVADTGKGMSEDMQKHVFDTFAQELDSVSKGNQGTGLGLPISRKLALLMGGDLTFESRKGKGTTFTFTFTGRPTSIAEKQEWEELDSSKSEQGDKKPRILVAEDNELNGEIILEILNNGGFEADLAENGRVVYKMFAESKPGTYGLILMDLLMPEMDGFAAAMAIRSLDRPDAKDVKIFACTANSLPQDRKKALDSGMNDFITKPLDIEELLRKIKDND